MLGLLLLFTVTAPETRMLIFLLLMVSRLVKPLLNVVLMPSVFAVEINFD
jgi:hypothetical protein